MARQFGRSSADAVIRESVPFLWLCGPSGVGKSAVGYEIFQQVYQSGIKAGFMDFGQFGLCYPSPADDPHNHGRMACPDPVIPAAHLAEIGASGKGRGL